MSLSVHVLQYLSKMSSIAYTQGFYYVPRIDKEIIKKYKSDLIVLTGNLYGEIPSKILNTGEEQAEECRRPFRKASGSGRRHAKQPEEGSKQAYRQERGEERADGVGTLW